MFDNAVFLCAQCHRDFGHRPDKRKLIRENRDWWYELVERRYSSKAIDGLESLAQSVATKEDLARSEQNLREYFNGLVNSLVVSAVAGTTSPSEVVNAASTMVSSIAAVGSVTSVPLQQCPTCGRTYQMTSSDQRCPFCDR